MSSIHVEQIESPLVECAHRQFSPPEIVERCAGAFMLAIATPLVAMAAVAIVTLSRRSPLVAHLRVGKDRKPLWIWKLRTMWGTGEADPLKFDWIEYVIADPVEGGKDPFDPRVRSPFASFCRRHSLDELPQLWHVVRGEMSLVGPRPLTSAEVARHYGSDATDLLSVKPGLTGLWQVYGRSAIQFPHRAAMDLELVRTLTPRMYLKIVARTFPAVIFGKGAY